MKTKLVLVAMSLAIIVALSAQEARYEIKTAVITKTMDMMGQKMDAVQNIDDYGKRESVTIKMPAQGLPGTFTHMRTITKGDTIISINLGLKTGMKMALPQKPVNYLDLTPETIEMYKIVEMGQEEVAGKPCKKYSMEISQMGQTANVTAWVWKGIALKTVSSLSGTTFTEETKEVKENATIDPEEFTIPEDVTIQTM